MKKNNLSNPKIISAMLVGISAMMSMAGPITAYAEDAPNESAGSDNRQAVEEETASSENNVTKEAQEQASEALEAIETAEEKTEAVSEAPVSAEEAGAVSSEAVEAANEDAAAIGGGEESDRNENLESAAENITNVQTALSEAEEADKAAEEEAKEAIDSVQTAAETAENIKASADEAAERAEEIAEKVKAAESEEEAKEAYSELTKLIEDTGSDIDAKKELFERLNNQYEQAKKALEEAETAYQNALTDAQTSAENAKEELEKAQTNVDALKSAVDTAKEKLDAEAKAAENINALQNTGVSWENQRARMQSIVVNYYIPQVIDSGATNIKFVKFVRGYDKQDYNYNIFTYTDSEGVEQTVYFNYDRDDKKLSKDRYVNLGGSREIIVFQKSQEEIDANTYLIEYFKAKGIKFTDSELHTKANSGELDVFAYEDNGKTQFLVREELNALKESGDITADGDTLLIDGKEIHEVKQNQNSKVNGGAIAVSTKDDEAFKAFCKNAEALSERYEEYDTAVADAQSAVDDARKKAEKLEETIGSLKDSRGNRIVKAAEVLGVDDIAAFLGLDIADEQANALNEMTLEQAIKYLDAILAAAKDKITEAEDTLSALEAKREEAAAELDKLIARYNAASENYDAGDEASETSGGASDTSENTVEAGTTANAGEIAEDDGNTIAAAAGDTANADGAAVLGAARAIGGAGNRSALAADNTSDTGSGDTELVDTKATDGAENAGIINLSDDKGKEDRAVTIEDEDTALASVPDEAKSGFGWWWLLIVAAITGVSAEELYRRKKARAK